MASKAPLSLGTRSSSSADSHVRGQRQHPTRDLMRLYTKMRDLRDELTLNELLNWRETPASSTNQLLPPTPDATTMSRSTSQASSCSESVNQGLNGMNIAASPSSDDAPKRLGRHGPLTDFAKARTAFIRKLKACPECRNRKVQCRHHNLELFEIEYRHQKTIQVTPTEISRGQATAAQATAEVPWTPTPLPVAPGQTVYTNDHRDRTSDLLRGVTSGLALIPDTTQVLEAIDRLAEPSLPSTAVQLSSPTFPFKRQSRVANDATYMSIWQSPAKYENPIPVGREVEAGTSWECQGQAPGEKDCCRGQFPTIELLGAHFREIHQRFREMHPPYLFRCRACGCHNDQPSYCFSCDTDDVDGFERWYYGSTIQQRPLAQFYADVFPAEERGGQHGPPSSYMPGQNSGSSNMASLAGWTLGSGLGHGTSTRFTARSSSTLSFRNKLGQQLSSTRDGKAKMALYEPMTRALSNSRRPFPALRAACYADSSLITLSLVVLCHALLSWVIRKVWLRAYMAGRVFIVAEAMRQVLGLDVPATGLFGQWPGEATLTVPQLQRVRERGVYT